MPSDLLKDLRIYAGMGPRIQKLLRVYDPALAHTIRLVHTCRLNAEIFLRVLFYLGRDDQNWVNSGQFPDDCMLTEQATPPSFPLGSEGPC